MKLDAIPQLFSAYRRFLKEATWAEILSLQFLGITTAAFNVLSLSIIVPFVSVVLTDNSAMLESILGKYLPQPMTFLWEGRVVLFLGLVIIVAYLVKSIASILFLAAIALSTERQACLARSRINLHMMSDVAPLDAEGRKARAIHANNLVPQLGSFFYSLIDVNLKVYVFLAILGFMFALSFKLTALSLGLAVLVLLVGMPLFQWTRSTSSEYYSFLGRTQALVISLIEGSETIKTLSVVDSQKKRLDFANRTIRNYSTALSVSRQAIISLPEFVVVAVIVSGLLFLKPDQKELVFLGSYIFSLVRLLSALNDLTSRANTALELRGAAGEVMQYLDALPAPGRPGSEGIALNDLKAIEFKNFGVKAANGKQILGPLGLRIPLQGHTLVYGPNGAGKSTIFRALLGLVPYSGEIFINGNNLSSLRSEDVYKRIAWFPQSHFLFSGTILENILIGSEQKSKSDVEQILREMGLENFFTRFPLGLMAPVYEEGKNLSGGERQLICILRILLKSADLYIFDEFTNHLDQETAAKVSRYIESHLRTVIYISHQPVQHCRNRIHVQNGTCHLEEGVEQPRGNP